MHRCRQSVHRCFLKGVIVVMSDQPAHGYTRKIIEQRSHGIPDRSGDVLKVHVDTMGARHGQLFGKVRCVMVNDRIKAEFVFHECALIRSPGNAHGTSTVQAGDLADH